MVVNGILFGVMTPKLICDSRVSWTAYKWDVHAGIAYWPSGLKCCFCFVSKDTLLWSSMGFYLVNDI